MADLNTSVKGTTIGLDLGDISCQVCVLDTASGEVLEEGRVRTTSAALTHRFTCAPARIAIEAGSQSLWISRLLKSLGHEVLVANPRKLRLIFENETKDDKVDARYLARVARLDPSLLAPIEHRDQHTQEDLVLLGARNALVAQRTRLVNMVRGQLKGFGIAPVKSAARTFHKRIVEQIPATLQPILTPILRVLAHLDEEIKDYDAQVVALATGRYAEAASAMTQVNGVGELTAVTFAATLHDPYRFKKSRTVGSFVGLRPRRQQSGASNPQLRITKAGNSPLRWILVQSAQYMLGPFGKDSDLRRWGLAIAERGGKVAKRRAVVAVARKLAVLLHRLWVTGEVYDPLKSARVKEAA